MYWKYFKPIIQIISYPTPDLESDVSEIIDLSEKNDIEIHKAMSSFLEDIRQEDLQRLREVYTTTFDLKAMACMDIGYVLFGEDYKRGAFLVEIQRLQKEHDVQSGPELPDHLPNMLKLIQMMPEDDEKRDLIEKILLPALYKILENFEQTQGKKNYYEYPLQALKVLLEREYKINDAILKGACQC